MPRTWVGSTAIFETANSGTLELGEKNVVTKIYTGDYADCVADALAKGTAGSGGLTGYIVGKSTVTKSRGGIGLLTIVWEAGGPDADPGSTPLPPDTFNLQSQDLNPSTEKNPGFATCAASTTLYKDDGSTGAGGKTLIGWVRLAGLAADGTESDAAWDALVLFTTTPGGTAFDEALVLADLLRRGVQNYYQASFIYNWTTASYDEPALSGGGFTEAAAGPLATAISGLGLSCLRTADDLQYQDGLYFRTRKWICAVAGHWESTLY